MLLLDAAISTWADKPLICDMDLRYVTLTQKRYTFMKLLNHVNIEVIVQPKRSLISKDETKFSRFDYAGDFGKDCG